MIRAFLEWIHRLLAPSYVAVGPPQRHKHQRVRVCRQHAPTEHPLTGSTAKIAFDRTRVHMTASDGLLVQRTAVDLLLADGRMTRLGIVAGFDPISLEPRRISYVPIHELAATEVV